MTEAIHAPPRRIQRKRTNEGMDAMTDDRAAQIRSRVADWLTRHRHRRLDCSLFEEQADAILAEVAVLLDWMAASREREIPATIREKLNALPTYQWYSEGMTPADWQSDHGSVSADYVQLSDVEALILSLLQAQETPSEPSGPDVYVKVDSRGIIVGASVTLSFFDSAENIELVHGPVVLFRHISEYKRREEKPAAQETAGWWQPIRDLVEKWRNEGRRIDTFHATMGIGFNVCADQLEALLPVPPLAETSPARQNMEGMT